MAEYPLVDMLLPIQISVLPGLIFLKAMATPFLYLLPVYIQPCLMIWGGCLLSSPGGSSVFPCAGCAMHDPTPSIGLEPMWSTWLALEVKYYVARHLPQVRHF